MLAVKNQHLDCVKALVNIGGANLNLRNFIGNTVAHIAALNGHLEEMKFILEHNINLLVRNDEGLTCLDHAEKRGFTDVKELLLPHVA